jgi:hypothetical protein
MNANHDLICVDVVQRFVVFGCERRDQRYDAIGPKLKDNPKLRRKIRHPLRTYGGVFTIAPGHSISEQYIYTR